MGDVPLRPSLQPNSEPAAAKRTSRGFFSTSGILEPSINRKMALGPVLASLVCSVNYVARFLFGNDAVSMHVEG